jgi:hypothetical protein
MQSPHQNRKGPTGRLRKQVAPERALAVGSGGFQRRTTCSQLGEELFMRRLNVHSLGLVFGSGSAFCHILWLLFVWTGAAQGALEFICRLYMVDPPYRIAAFQLSNAAALVALATLAGYAFGVFLALLWNRFLSVSRRPLDHLDHARAA